VTDKRQIWLAMAALIVALGVGLIGSAKFVQYQFAHHTDFFDLRPSRHIPCSNPAAVSFNDQIAALDNAKAPPCVGDLPQH
jgi:hypothetical protein